MSPAQKNFDDTYITSAQIMRDLRVSRAGLLYARKRGLLPNPIVVNHGQLFIWERATVTPHLEAWQRILNARRGVRA
jgi:hypothetical protein